MSTTPAESGPSSGPRRIADFFVGPWLVRADLNRLERNGDTVQVEPRVFQVLLFLSERPSQVVAREALLDRVWADVVVSEETLTRAISELRHILGDDPRTPSFIETIRKGGYRLIAPIRPADESPEETPAEPDRPAPPRRRLLAGAAAAVVLLALGWAAVKVGAVLGGPNTEVLEARPFTSYPGEEVRPSISADGSRVAFAWAGPDQTNYDIYVKQRNTETPFRLTDHPAPESNPAWSPDSAAIAFIRGTRAVSEVYTVPAIGGPERRVYAAGTLIDSLDWSPDGTWLVLAERAEPAAPCALVLVSLTSQDRRVLTTPPEQYTGDILPAFSPDGEQVAFVRGDRIGLNDLFVVPFAGGDPTRLTDGGSGIRGFDWEPDGRHLLFSSITRGPFGLWRLDADSGRQTRITVNVEYISHPSVAAAAGTVVLENRSFELSVWHIGIEDPSIPRHRSEPLIGSTRIDTQARYSPDGGSIAFISGRSGWLEVWIAAADGSTPVQLTQLEGSLVGNPRWSPDGRRIAFYTPDGEHAAVFVVDVDTGTTTKISNVQANDRMASWSRDGLWLYVGSDRTGSWQVWKLASDGSDDLVQVTTDGGIAAQESVDGTRLYLVKPDVGGIWELGDDNRSHLVAPWLALRDWDNWVVQPDGIYFLRSDLGGPPALAHFDPDTRQVRSILRFPRPPSRRSLALSPDGKSVLYSRVDNVQADLMVIEGGE